MSTSTPCTERLTRFEPRDRHGRDPHRSRYSCPVRTIGLPWVRSVRRAAVLVGGLRELPIIGNVPPVRRARPGLALAAPGTRTDAHHGQSTTRTAGQRPPPSRRTATDPPTERSQPSAGMASAASPAGTGEVPPDIGAKRSRTSGHLWSARVAPARPTPIAPTAEREIEEEGEWPADRRSGPRPPRPPRRPGSTRGGPSRTPGRPSGRGGSSAGPNGRQVPPPRHRGDRRPAGASAWCSGRRPSRSRARGRGDPRARQPAGLRRPPRERRREAIGGALPRARRRREGPCSLTRRGARRGRLPRSTVGPVLRVRARWCAGQAERRRPRRASPRPPARARRAGPLEPGVGLHDMDQGATKARKSGRDVSVASSPAWVTPCTFPRATTRR